MKQKATKKKEPETAPQYENESVIPTREDKLFTYSLYSYLFSPEKQRKQLDEVELGRLHSLARKALVEGRYTSAGDAYEAVEAENSTALYKRIADSPEEAIAILQRTFVGSVEPFIDTREPLIVSALIPYIESVLLAGMRGKLSVWSWWRLVNYGFSVEPWDEDNPDTFTQDGQEYIAVRDFPYTSVSEMSEKDREAFRLLAVDYYYEVLGCSSTDFIKGKQAENENTSIWAKDWTENYSLYPKEGYTASEIARRHSDKDEKLTEQDVRDSWEFEPELFFPFLIARVEETLYYGMKYSGSEYKTYLESVDVEKDWNEHFESSDKSDKYNYKRLITK